MYLEASKQKTEPLTKHTNSTRPRENFVFLSGVVRAAKLNMRTTLLVPPSP